MTPAHHWLDARLDRVEAERKLRKVRTRTNSPLFDVLLRVEEKLTEESRAREARALEIMERSTESRWELGQGFAIERVNR